MDLDDKIRWTETVLYADDTGAALDTFADAVLDDYKSKLTRAIRERLKLCSPSDHVAIELELLLDSIVTNSIDGGA